jgi:DNA-binding CsgD family transcriptional regulator
VDRARRESTSYRLRRTILDAQRAVAPPAMLDCGAHMLLYLDRPQMVQRIGLQHLLERFAATRVDLGFGTPNDPNYQACAVERQVGCNIPDVLGVTWPNRHRGIQAVWRSKSTIHIDVCCDPTVSELRPALERVRTRVKMARRLEYRNRSFGIVCIDQTEERRQWSESDLAYLDQFVLGLLSPILAEIRPSQSESRGSLTPAERAVVRLASLGMSYKEIAAELHKSPNTVDNQLRKIREKLGVRNQIELVCACANLL